MPRNRNKNSLLSRVFLPSTLPEYHDKDKKYRKQGETIRKELEDERNFVVALLKRLIDDRKALYYKLYAGPDPHMKIANEYAESVKTFQALKQHLVVVNTQLTEVTAKFRTSACHDASGYYGLTDWAEKSLAKYAYLCDAIGAASVFGAGITYTTIFGATRGNIGLMCWAFALFDTGFIITTLVRSSLMWAARLTLPEKSFATTIYWELMIHIALGIAFTSAITAIFILNLPIFQLAYEQDSIRLEISPTPSAIISIIMLVGTVFTAMVLLVLSWWADDFKWARRDDAMSTEDKNFSSFDRSYP